MELINLKAQHRDTRGKGAAKRNRKDGVIPAIVYGEKFAPAPLSIDGRTFLKILQDAGQHALIQLEVDGGGELSGATQVKQVQYDPIKEDVLHVDFLRIRLDETLTTSVPLVLEGNPPGVQEGGILEQTLRELEIECLALDVPEEIAVPVGALAMGDSIHVSELNVPEKVTVLTDPERTVATVTVPRVVVEEGAEAAEEEAEAAEVPEVGEEAEES